jgi:aspartyl aminopeptidase
MMVTMSTSASAAGLCEFIDASPSPFHVCATAAERLRAAGYTELAETDRWNNAAGRYFTVRAGSLIAWHRPAALMLPFRVVGGHTDSPNLRVKQHPDSAVAGWQVVALQPYGGAWLNSWLDRDLGISGRISVRDERGVARARARGNRHAQCHRFEHDVSKCFRFAREQQDIGGCVVACEVFSHLKS